MDEQKLTPMMRQYLDIKQEYREEVLFFRLGDFYEMFMEDAKEVSHLLNLTLTARNGVPMCGIPYHAAKNYIKRLLEAGKKIAICEQMEPADSTPGLTRREVQQVITPGTAIEEEFLDSSQNNYIVSLFINKKEISCACCELSSGLFELFSIPAESHWDSLRSVLEELSVRELIVCEDDYFSHPDFAAVLEHAIGIINKLPSWYFSQKEGYEILCAHMGTVSLKQFGIEKDDVELMAAGALFRYLKQTVRTSLAHITAFTKIDRQLRMQMDESTRKNLELCTNLQDGSEKYTLFSAINATCTAGGARLLKQWITSPLVEIDRISFRQEQVAWLVEQPGERQRIRTILGKTRDLVRLASRVSLHRASPQDVVAIRQCLAAYFSLMEQHTQRYRTLLDPALDDAAMDELVSLMDMLFAALNDQCQGPFMPFMVIQEGYSEELDRLRDLASHGDAKISAYVEKLKEETKIPVIKLSHNKIIGHYLEIPKTHNAKIPPSFYRKQTLVHAERYTTEELAALESEIHASIEEAQRLERKLFDQVVERTSQLVPNLLAVGMFFSTVDCLQSFAQKAVQYHYCRPEITLDDVLDIEEGRHPVVEQQLPIGTFVPNPLCIDETSERFCLITAPNMAGKSTYLRQHALIVLLSHIGSFVPAKRARIGIVDKLYCRVGASDNLARGESTFLIEMQEAAFILKTATRRSFVIMDELGRGTSTQDGMSIAYAVMQYLVNTGVKTLFATHYHELTMLDTSHMQLLTLEVSESRKQIVFLRKLHSGVAASSYGLHVARMAGIPMQVLHDAALFQKKHFSDYALQNKAMQLDLFAADPVLPSIHDEIANAVKDFSLEESTPMEAMRFIEELKERLADEA